MATAAAVEAAASAAPTDSGQTGPPPMTPSPSGNSHDAGNKRHSPIPAIQTAPWRQTRDYRERSHYPPCHYREYNHEGGDTPMEHTRTSWNGGEWRWRVPDPWATTPQRNHPRGEATEVQVELPHGGGTADPAGHNPNDGLGEGTGKGNRDQHNGKGGSPPPPKTWRQTPRPRRRPLVPAPRQTDPGVTSTQKPSLEKTVSLSSLSATAYGNL